MLLGGHIMQKPRFKNFTVDYLVDETLREGIERSMFNISYESRYKLLLKMIQSGLREFVAAEPSFVKSCLEKKLELQEIPQDVKFVHIILLNHWEEAYLEIKNWPKHFIEDVVFSFGMIDYKKSDNLIEQVITKFRDLGARLFKASILNNFSGEFLDKKYQAIQEQVNHACSLEIPTIRINDSVGTIFPEDTALLCNRLTDDFKEITFCFHTHNDSGLAIANAMTSIYHCFNMIEGTLAGFGNRSGIPPIDMIVKLCERKNIKLAGHSIDSKILVEATQLAERLFLTIPNVYRPNSGIFEKRVNYSLTNIPDYLKADGERDYFFNQVGIHPKVIRQVLIEHKFDRLLIDDNKFISRVMNELTNSTHEIYEKEKIKYEKILNDFISFYTDGVFSKRHIYDIATSLAKA
jgi:2-isopropylmalate synthase